MKPYHPINLCQPDSQKSCGACCGLYNWQDHSRATLKSILEIKTNLFFSLENFEDLQNYRQKCIDQISYPKLFETIYNCEFLGFIDIEHKKVGCLLHPSITGRVDLRHHCFYGIKVCNEHFCPSFGCLTTIEQSAVVQSIDDWYLYGLVITDIDLVKEFFKYIENTIGDSIKEEKIKNNPGIHDSLIDFFKLKKDWKFKSYKNRLGKYYFSEAEYNISRIDYKMKWGIKPSRFDKILISLESELNSYDDLLEAEAIIEEKIRKFIDVYEAV
jgi:hypothetical protein